MFTIYQIHKQGGECDEYFDNIVCSYLHKGKAEQELKKLNDSLNEQYAHYQKCLKCPAKFGCLAGRIDKIIENCDCFEPGEDRVTGLLFCKNAVYSYGENVRYEIEEVDVDEEGK